MGLTSPPSEKALELSHRISLQWNTLFTRNSPIAQDGHGKGNNFHTGLSGQVKVSLPLGGTLEGQQEFC